MIYSLREFIENILLESLHPELHAIVTQPSKRGTSIQTELAKKVKELTKRGEETGIEGNMPKGSSRAYLRLQAPEKIDLDGKRTELRTGLKVAIRARLDRFHNPEQHDGMDLGQLQNKAEGGDHFVNSQHRVIVKDHSTGKYHTNTESGIFPPLIDHDDKNHNWTHVGHVDNIRGKKFRELTKTKSHPKGISHSEFCSSLDREWNRQHDKYWDESPDREKHNDHIKSHPLVQKFLDHQINLGAPPHDYSQIQNMGIWKHPHTGEEHIVARDHGFSENVMKAYKNAHGKLIETRQRTLEFRWPLQQRLP